MSFNASIKEELSRKNSIFECCQKYLLCSMLKVTGSLVISKKKWKVSLDVNNASIVRKLFNLLNKMYDLKIDIKVIKKEYLNKKNKYVIELPDQPGLKKLLFDCNIVDDNLVLKHQLPPEVKKNSCCKKAYLRGVYLVAGSISDPHKNYHFEIRVRYLEYAKEIKKLFGDFGVNLKIKEVNNKYLIYAKSSEDIINVLNILGANKALLKMENIRILKEIKNITNRKMNYEIANMERTIEAAQKQLESIRTIKKNRGLNSLTPALKEAALLRLNNPYSSLSELSKDLDVTKSGLNHRFRRINKLAKNITNESD